MTHRYLGAIPYSLPMDRSSQQANDALPYQLRLRTVRDLLIWLFMFLSSHD